MTVNKDESRFVPAGYVLQNDGRYKGPDGRFYIPGRIEAGEYQMIEATTTLDLIREKRDAKFNT